MEKEDFWIFCLSWLGANAPVLVDLLKALVPVLALVLAAYALHVATEKGRNRRD